jgi:hypothetical protein
VPVEFGVWRLEGSKPHPLQFVPMATEKRLEDVLAEDIDILGLPILLIGRQVPTEAGGYIDLLAIDASGDLYVIELKRDRTPRDVIAQVLDYATWVRGLSYDDIKAIHERHGVHRGPEFEEVFADAFGDSPDETLNENHRLVVVAAELDASSERIVSYLSDQYGVPINAVFFRHFHDEQTGSDYLARSWLIDPATVEVKANRAASRREPWNGHDYYVTFGNTEIRLWEDAHKYGFVSASGGPRWIKPLKQLSPGDRVFTLVPGSGYVGVGIVEEAVVPISQFVVDGKPLLEHPLASPALDKDLDDPERCEHVVRVSWQKALPEDQGYWEKGMFAIPISVCPLRQSFTIEKVSRHFDIPPYGPS